MHVVEELSARIGTLQQQLEAAKELSIAKQMRAFRTDEFERSLQRGGLRLHLGCGRNTLSGWLNADLFGWRLNTGDGWEVNRAKERVLSINVGTTPLPLPDGCCEYVYTSHMLEHLIHPAQTRLVRVWCVLTTEIVAVAACACCEGECHSLAVGETPHMPRVCACMHVRACACVCADAHLWRIAGRLCTCARTQYRGTDAASVILLRTLMQVMEEVHRVLAPGGVVRVVVPDAAVWLRGYVNQDPRFFATVRREWPFWNWDALDTLAAGEGGGAGGGLDYILPYLGASSLNGHLSGDHQVISATITPTP